MVFGWAYSGHPVWGSMIADLPWTLFLVGA